jgi:gamma-glutamyltranspeptidase / glutathione hydrolase
MAGPVTGRSVVFGRDGMVATSQPMAAAIGVSTLQQGGTAVDAAIAANAAMGVLEPTGCGVGGDLFALVHTADDGRTHGLDAAGWAPAGLTPDRLERMGVSGMPSRGIHSVTVPGAVAGWAALHERFGRLPIPTLLAPAIRLAESGYPVAPVTAALWAASEAMLAADPEAARTFLPAGRAPAPGGVFRNAALGGTLRRIADSGRAGFYEGPVADAMVAVSDAHGGTLSHPDLSEYRAEWVDPIRAEYRGWTVHELGPQTQGIAALLMLGIMEHFPLADWGLHSADALHVMIEAKKLAYAEMIAHVGDPRRSRIPVGELLDPAHLRRLADRIHPGHAAHRVEPSRFPGITDRPASHTIYLATADRHGNLVSLIQSNYEGFGSGLVPSGSGFMLQNRGALFTLEAGHPNRLAPRARPLHTIIPGFMERGGTRIAFGIMGGWNQAQAHAQFVAGIADYGLDLQQALEAGRFTKATFEGADVEVEASVPAAARAELERRGHELTVRELRTPRFGFGHAVASRDDVRSGAADPRHDGAAIPEPPPSDASEREE